MKVSKETVRKIQEIISHNAECLQSDLIQIIRENEEIPNLYDLFEKDLKRTCTRIIAALRDADGDRVAYAAGKRADGVIVNTELSSNRSLLTTVMDKLRTIADGADRSLNKIRSRTRKMNFPIEGQMSLFKNDGKSA